MGWNVCTNQSSISRRSLDCVSCAWTCDCQLVWFRNWLNRNGTKKKFYKTEPYQYRCCAPAEEENVLLSNLTQSFDENCFTDSPDYWLAFVSIFVIITSTASAVGSMLHRFRRHVRYYVYISKVCSIHKINYTKMLHDQQVRYTNDVYVASI